jgi:hypothetical protein
MSDLMASLEKKERNVTILHEGGPDFTQVHSCPSADPPRADAQFSGLRATRSSHRFPTIMPIKLSLT